MVGELTHFEFRHHSRRTINYLDNQESLIFGVSEALFQSTVYSSPIYNLSLFLYFLFQLLRSGYDIICFFSPNGVSCSFLALRKYMTRGSTESHSFKLMRILVL